MNPIRCIRRVAGVLAGLAGALLASAAAAPAAFASGPRPVPPGWNKHPPLPAPCPSTPSSSGRPAGRSR